MVGSAERLKVVEPETGCRNQYAQGYALAWAFDRWHSVPREGCVDAPRPCRFLFSRRTGSDAPTSRPSAKICFFLRDTALAMSRENVDALRAVYDEWAKGNFQAGGDLWDQRVLFIPIAELPDSGDYHGPEGVSRFMRGFLEPWMKYTIAAEKFRAVGDSVVVATRQHGIGRDSGIAGGRSQQTHVWTFRGGVVIRFEAFANRAEALEAVGVCRQDGHAGF
jgi:uncharacterized protein